MSHQMLSAAVIVVLIGGMIIIPTSAVPWDRGGAASAGDRLFSNSTFLSQETLFSQDVFSLSDPFNSNTRNTQSPAGDTARIPFIDQALGQEREEHDTTPLDSTAPTVPGTVDAAERPDDTPPVAGQACQEEIDAAQAAADTADGCRLETRDMKCPHDLRRTYEARNSCEITVLEESGWTPDDPSPVDDENDRPHPATRFTIQDTTYSVDQSAAVTFTDTSVTVTGTIAGNNGCYTARLADSTIDGDTLHITIESYEDREETEGCHTAVIGIQYEAVIPVAGEHVTAATIHHNGEPVTRVVRDSGVDTRLSAGER